MKHIIECIKEVAYARAQRYRESEFWPMMPSEEDYICLHREFSLMGVMASNYDGLLERFFISRFHVEISEFIEKNLEEIQEKCNEMESDTTNYQRNRKLTESL